MNILPLTFTFLIILSCIAFTFLRETKSISLIENAMRGFNRAERAVNNAIVSKAYKKIPTQAIPKTEEGKSKKKTDYPSLRITFPPLESSKFNLGALIQQEEGEIRLHPLYGTLAAFLRLLYEKILFAEGSKIEYRIIDAMIKKAQKHPDVSILAKLHPDDPALAKIFYQMLKGTNQYTRKQGVPPLGDFLVIHDEKTAASLSFASPVLLEALFGEECAHQILKEEQKKCAELGKYYYFSKQDLQPLLMKNPAWTSLFSTLDPYLNYSKQKEKREQIGKRDKTTGIALEKKL